MMKDKLTIDQFMKLSEEDQEEYLNSRGDSTPFGSHTTVSTTHQPKLKEVKSNGSELSY